VRSFRREILSIGAVFALPLLVLAFFPREAFFFRATPAPRQPEAFLAFTTVSPDEEARLIASLQTTWKPALSSDEGLHLSLRDLPEDPQEPLRSYNIRFTADFVPQEIPTRMLVGSGALCVRLNEDELQSMPGASLERFRCSSKSAASFGRPKPFSRPSMMLSALRKFAA